MIWLGSGGNPLLVSLFVCFKAWVVEPEYCLGGGAGGAGSASTSESAGCGGIGKTSNITGTVLYWAGGGGECSPSSDNKFFFNTLHLFLLLNFT